jgi:hypothetical protein
MRLCGPSMLDMREARTREAVVAALRVRLRKMHGAARCGLATEAWFLSSRAVPAGVAEWQTRMI